MSRGIPAPVDDGRTTRERRHQPLLIVHTGEGKGKTTAAAGLALRAWAQGWSIGVYQFIKRAAWRTGERSAFEALHAAHVSSAGAVGGPVDWHVMGTGWSWSRSHAAGADPAELAREGWQRVCQDLAEERHTLTVLDEFSYPMAWGWVDTEEVVTMLRDRPGHQHVVITGRRAPQALIDAADLVTEFTKVTHPFDRGAKGQAGIEW